MLPAQRECIPFDLRLREGIVDGLGALLSEIETNGPWNGFWRDGQKEHTLSVCHVDGPGYDDEMAAYVDQLVGKYGSRRVKSAYETVITNGKTTTWSNQTPGASYTSHGWDTEEAQEK